MSRTRARPVVIPVVAVFGFLVVLWFVLPGPNKSAPTPEVRAGACYFGRQVEQDYGIVNIAKADLAHSKRMQAGAAGLAFQTNDGASVPRSLQPVFKRFFSYTKAQGKGRVSQATALADAVTIRNYLNSCRAAQ